MVDDGLEHLSKRTRERAFILARNAKTLGIPLGKVRFTPRYDYMSYYLTDGSAYVIIFCTPDGYLVEFLTEVDKEVVITYLGIKNIRHFLQYIAKRDFQDIDVVFGEETDLRGYVEDLDDEGE